MKGLFLIGLIVLILGIASFFVPIPHSETQGIKAGDVNIGVQTQHSEKLSPIIGVVLVVAGAGLMIAGRGGKA
jgi:uncharacterized membrane protein YjfL (UPF0719 family)